MKPIDDERAAAVAPEGHDVPRLGGDKPASTAEREPARFRLELRTLGEPRPARAASQLPSGSTRTSTWTLGFALFAGVILPAVTAVVEYLTGACAQIFFNPVPTRWHVALIVFVSLANLAVFASVVTGKIRAPRLAAGANAMALGVSGIYAVLFLPLAPLAVVAFFTLVLAGHALLALAPLLAFAATLLLRRVYRRELAAGPVSDKLPRVVWGLALAALAFVLLDAGITLTRVGMHWASGNDAALRERGVGMLRTFGDQETLLQACYARRGRSLDILGFLFTATHPVSPEQARQVYYRVTGESFDRQAEPGGWGLLGFGFDANQGGARAGQLLPGLSLSESQLDGSVDPNAALGYLEWTMVFANANPRAVEARAEIQLPPDAVVSRVTLWIDGEEREAAFGGKAQVREAYERVVRARRDPLLVTSSGKDRVLAQCFPVPADGEMKIRLGITMPLETHGAVSAMALPHILERNFEAAESRHNVWIEADSPFEVSGDDWRTERAPDGAYAVRALLSGESLEDPAGVLLLKRDAGPGAAWTPDPTDPESFAIRQQPEHTTHPPVGRLVVVIDGSAGMNPLLDPMADAIETALEGFDYEIAWASDTVERLGANPSRLRALRGAGGSDNVPALQLAYQTAAAHPGAAILWIHGPQPILLEPPGPLHNNWRRRAGHPGLYTLRAAAGPNKVLEALEELPDITTVSRIGGLRDDLVRALERLRSPSVELSSTRERIERPREIPLDWGPRKSAHLARLWAKDETERLSGSRKAEEREQAVRLAAAHQIVTAVSGAVVLESQAQYEQSSLTPADRSSVPTIPEPETMALMLVAAALLYAQWLSRRRRWKRA